MSSVKKKANVGRIVFLFLYCFGCIIVPAGIILALTFLFMPHPYIANSDLLSIGGSVFADADSVFGRDAKQCYEEGLDQMPNATAAEWCEFKDGSRVIIAAYPSEKEAKSAKRYMFSRSMTSSSMSDPWEISYKRSDDGQRGFITTAQNYLIAIEAPTKELVKTRFESIPAFAKNPDPNFIKTVFDKYTLWLVIVFIIYALAQIPIWSKLATWASKISADKVSPAVSENELKERLLQINKLDVPFSVAVGKRSDEIIAEWKYVDAKWMSIMSAGGLKKLYRLKLRLDKDAHRVMAQEMSSSVSWNVDPTSSAAANFRWTYFKGINFFQYERGVAYGLLFKDGTLKFDKAYDYRFLISEIKNPIIDIVTGSGWDYSPVLTFIKFLN